MPWRGQRGVNALEHLSAEDGWRLLDSHSAGRLCFCVGDRVQVTLTPYVTRGHRIYFRAVAFGSVARRASTRPVTLEVDDLHADLQATWTVTATGVAQHVDDAATLASLWTPVRPALWGVGQESLWIELVPDDVQGRRIRG